MSLLRKIFYGVGSVCLLSSMLHGEDLPPGPNRELVMANCLACHSAKLILQNRMTRQRWDEKISWMQKTQNLWPLSKEVRSKILDYLETVQGVQNSLPKRDAMDGLGPRNVNVLPN